MSDKSFMLRLYKIWKKYKNEPDWASILKKSKKEKEHEIDTTKI